MNGKIKISPLVLAQLQDAAPDALVTLTLRTWTPLTTEEINALTSLGGRLYYDNGMMAILTVPAQHVGTIVEWELVLNDGNSYRPRPARRRDRGVGTCSENLPR